MLTQSDEMLLPLLYKYLTHYHQTPDPGCRSRQTSQSLALVDQKRHISPSEAFTDSCQPEHLVATVTDTISRRENTTVLTGILVLSFTLLPGLLAHAFFQAAQTTLLQWGTSFFHAILHQAVDTMGSGSLRTGYVGVSAHEVWLSQSPPDRPGTRQALCV